MTAESEKSLGNDATFAGRVKQPVSSRDVSIGDERTLGDGLSGQDTVSGDIEIVDLESRYTMEGTLGQGGMGAVLLATDTRLGRKVAIKRILGEAAGNRMAVQRFLTEAKAIAALNHPNIVQIYDYGRAKDGPFLIMEYVAGGSLLDRCRESALPLEEAIALACQLCDGLAKAHDLGIVHRDIKPANVLLTKDGTPKLTDFGLAKAEASDHGMTMTGAVLGTPDFMPPEQRRDASEVDSRSDLWSLAATVYQMVTGRSPKIIRFDLLPASLTKVLGKALEDGKDARYQSAREFRDALLITAGGPTKSTAVVAVEEVDGALQEGQCKACGTVTSDLTKKFCRNPKCGASLRVPCLKCDAQIPVWDGVCGECGGNQPSLLNAHIKSLSARRLEAERLVAELAFDAAVQCVEGIAEESRPECAEIAAWAKSFVAASTEEAARRQTAARQSLEDARKHVEACDYPAAIHTLETIPEPMRHDEASRLLAECRSRHENSTQLIEEIAARIKRKDIEGLLPIVERAAELRGDRKDLATIRGQLVERRDTRMARARNAFAKGDVRGATAALAKTAIEDHGPDDMTFISRVRQIGDMEEQLASLVKEAKADSKVTATEAASIFALGAAYLKLNPRHQAIRSLVVQSRQIAWPSVIRNSIGMELIQIPAGSFMMGMKIEAKDSDLSLESILDESDDGDDFELGDEGGNTALHRELVELTQPFYLGIHPVTNAQWRAVMQVAPSTYGLDDQPVQNVGWDDVVTFCRRLSKLPEEQSMGRVYRPPTEKEWEYACRAGTTTHYSFGNEESQLGKFAWFANNSGSEPLDADALKKQAPVNWYKHLAKNDCHPHSVGQKGPNAWGLYDMHGNVWEWCEITSRGGESHGSQQVIRGGSWNCTAADCRSASRIVCDGNANRGAVVGCRVAVSLPSIDFPEVPAA